MVQHTGGTGENAAAEWYRGASGREYHEGKRGLRPEAIGWVMRRRARKFQAYVRPGDTVFELGVGAGWNLGELRCARRIGCDASDFLENEVRQRQIEFVRDTTALPDGLADVAICHHTLEHMLNPAETMIELGRLLKPSGRLIVHVPWERERQHRRYRTDEPNHHLYTWNAQNLGNLAVVTGYAIDSIRVRRYGYDRFAANLSARLRLGRSGFELIRKCLIAMRPLKEVELLASPRRA